MTKAKTERRRNQYAGQCGVCYAEVAAGAGWLYSDTRSSNSRSRRRATGNWIKVVRCDRCHGLGVSHRNQLPENAPPKPVKLGVEAIRKGRFVPTYEKLGNWMGTTVRLVLTDGTSEIIAQPEPITCEPVGVGEYYEDRLCFGGRALTHAAAIELVRLGWYAAESLETMDLRRSDD